MTDMIFSCGGGGGDDDDEDDDVKEKFYPKMISWMSKEPGLVLVCLW